MEDLLLQVKDLKTYFYTDDGVVKAVDSIDFTILTKIYLLVL